MNGEDKVRLTVDIFGNSYKMVGSFSEKYMKQISTYVNEHMNAIAKSNPRLDTQKVAILALVHMADDYYQLRQQLDQVEAERAQTKQHIEELRKAFELSEEKERTKSAECLRLEERAAKLEEELARLARENELASAAWAERVMEWEIKYEELAKDRERLVLEAAAAREEAAASLGAANRGPADTKEPAEEQPQVVVTAPSELSPDDATLLEKYNKLQEEYLKLQNEFNEWIQLTQSETQ
ncbi:cell division protein ZapA [Paenibacillus alkalitolerans]|uniref:cell division protein ZapA n=1 Tax=Paenibacillus alkalitolerans TaxID=2799335 RepID=UPI0018F6BE5B|nr:cell division protein ZapA [Paenibacillus alkalitolerans]